MESKLHHHWQNAHHYSKADLSASTPMADLRSTSLSKLVNHRLWGHLTAVVYGYPIFPTRQFQYRTSEMYWSQVLYENHLAQPTCPFDQHDTVRASDPKHSSIR